MKKPVRKAGAMGPGSVDKAGAKFSAAKKLRAQPMQDKLRGVPSEDGFFAGSLNSALGFKPTKNQRRQEAADKLGADAVTLMAKSTRDRKAGSRMAKAQAMQKANRSKMK
jgi:hypothetical protein